MMLTLRSLAFNVLFYCWSTVLQVSCLPAILMPPDVVTWVQRTWVRGNFALLALVCGLRYEIRGRDRMPPEPCIIAAKHQSAWDTMIFALIVKRPSQSRRLARAVGRFVWQEEPEKFDSLEVVCKQDKKDKGVHIVVARPFLARRSARRPAASGPSSRKGVSPPDPGR